MLKAYFGLLFALGLVLVSSSASAGGTYDRTFSTTQGVGKRIDSAFVGSRTNANAFDMGGFKGASITKFRGAFLGQRERRAPIGFGLVTKKGKSELASPVLNRSFSVHVGSFNFGRQVSDVVPTATHSATTHSTWHVGWNGRRNIREITRSRWGRGESTVRFNVARDGEMKSSKPLFTGRKSVRSSPTP